jgi:hypothetical protein
MFAEQWPNFIKQSLDPEAVAEAQGVISSKISGCIHQVFLLGLMDAFQLEDWEVGIEPRGGSGYINIQVVSIELKSSKKTSRRIPLRHSAELDVTILMWKEIQP